MLKNEIVKWIEKTFGKTQHRDQFEMTSKASEIIKQGKKFKIEELNFVFQRIKNDASEKDVKKWKEELMEITNNSLRVFHFGNEELYSIASNEDIKEGVNPGDLVKGKSALLNVQIFKETFLHAALLIPNSRRN